MSVAPTFASLYRAAIAAGASPAVAMIAARRRLSRLTTTTTTTTTTADDDAGALDDATEEGADDFGVPFASDDSAADAEADAGGLVGTVEDDPSPFGAPFVTGDPSDLADVAAGGSGGLTSAVPAADLFASRTTSAILDQDDGLGYEPVAGFDYAEGGGMTWSPWLIAGGLALVAVMIFGKKKRRR